MELTRTMLGEKIKYKHHSDSDFSVPSEITIPVVRSNRKIQQGQKQQLPHRSAGHSSSIANATTAPSSRSSTISAITSTAFTRHDDMQESSQPRKGNPRMEFSSKHDQLSRLQDKREQGRLDPPERVTAHHPFRYSLEKYPYPSKARSPSSDSQLSRRKHRNHAKLPPHFHDHGWKHNKAKEDQPSSHIHHQRCQQLRQELPHIYPARKNRGKMQRDRSLPPMELEESPPVEMQQDQQTGGQECQTDNLDDGDVDLRRGHCHPAKSSSFQVHPWQILQVYEDLQRQIELETSQSQRKGSGISDGDSISEERIKLKNTPPCVLSCKPCIIDSYREHHSQTTGSHTDKPEEYYVEPSISRSGSKLLRDLHDEATLAVPCNKSHSQNDDNIYYGTSQDRNVSNTTKITFLNQQGKKSNFDTRMFPRKVAVDCVNASVTTTSTNSGLTTEKAKSLKKQRRLQQQQGCSVFSDYFDGKKTQNAAPAFNKTREV